MLLEKLLVFFFHEKEFKDKMNNKAQNLLQWKYTLKAGDVGCGLTLEKESDYQSQFNMARYELFVFLKGSARENMVLT